MFLTALSSGWLAGIDGDNAPRAVFSSLVGRPRMLVILSDMDQEDSCSSLFIADIASFNALRTVFSSLVCRPMIHGIMAGMDQQYSCCGMCKAGISGDTLEFPQLQFLAQVVDFPFVPKRQLSMVPSCRKTIEISKFQYTVIDVPFCAGRDAEAYSHGSACLADHRDFAVAVRAGRSMSLLCRSSWFPGIRGGVGLTGSLVLHIRCRTRSRVHRDTVTIISCT